MNIKKLTIPVGAVMASLMAVGLAFAGAPWSLFGKATSIKDSTSPNPWVVELSSQCPSFPGFGCFGDGSFTFSGVRFVEPQGGLTFGALSELSADFNRTDDDCGAGSPRFQLAMDTDGDGTSNGNIFVYIGPQPSFAGCSAGWQNTGNLIGLPNSDPRYDLTQLGGAFYDTYNNALALFGSDTVLRISLVVDSGWNGPASGGDGEQTILVDNVTVNNHKMTGQNAK